MAAEPIDRAALRIEHIKGKGIGILAAKHLTRGQKVTRLACILLEIQRCDGAANRSLGKDFA